MSCRNHPYIRDDPLGVNVIIVYRMCSLKVEWGDSVMGNFVDLIVWQHILNIICIF